ncbi:hypothetical protein BC826DRAFT_1140735 [Russula brevipes]|nr:hypothetical protein BC826DRAFT_1140735 [Russula brevipes]
MGGCACAHALRGSMAANMAPVTCIVRASVEVRTQNDGFCVGISTSKTVVAAASGDDRGVSTFWHIYSSGGGRLQGAPGEEGADGQAWSERVCRQTLASTSNIVSQPARRVCPVGFDAAPRGLSSGAALCLCSTLCRRARGATQLLGDRSGLRRDGAARSRGIVEDVI